jgi:putative spermidine/putrescine transport system permease protein
MADTMKTRQTRLRLLMLAAPAIMVLALFFMVPIIAVLTEATTERALARFILDGGLLDALWRSILLGFTAAGVAVAIAIPVALRMSRLPPRARALVQVIVALPLTFSGVIIAYGFILVLGRSGFVTLLLAKLSADPATIASFLYGPGGLVLAYVYYLAPRVILVLIPVLINFDQRQVDAAQSLGATRLQALIDIMAPQIAPTVFSAFCLVWAVAVGSYGTALALVGTQINILPLRLYGMVSDSGTDFALAAATSLVLLVVCSLIMTVAEFAAAKTEDRHVRH